MAAGDPQNLHVWVRERHHDSLSIVHTCVHVDDDLFLHFTCEKRQVCVQKGFVASVLSAMFLERVGPHLNLSTPESIRVFVHSQ